MLGSEGLHSCPVTYLLRMHPGQPPQHFRLYCGRRGGGNRRVLQVYYERQDLAKEAIRRLVRIQCGNPNFLLPRQTHDPNSPYTALIVNTHWFGFRVCSHRRLPGCPPRLDAQIAIARQNAANAAPAAEGAAVDAPEPEQELNPAEPVTDPDQEPEEQENVPDETSDVEGRTRGRSQANRYRGSGIWNLNRLFLHLVFLRLGSANNRNSPKTR